MKKKILALILATITVLSLVACGGKETPDIETELPTEESIEVESTESAEVSGEDIIETEESGEMNYDYELSLETSIFLNEVFGLYAEDQKFPYGTMVGDIFIDGVPMEMDISDTDTLQSYIVFPADEVAKITEISSVVHMMNANIFTCAAMKLQDLNEADIIKEAIVDNVENNQWLCGAPEVMTVAVKDYTLIYAFGTKDVVDVFVEKLSLTDVEMTIDELIPLAGYELAE